MTLTDTHDHLPDEDASPPSRLRMAGISKHFLGVRALVDVSLDVRPGEVHALLGENGAGKSTLMNIASGALLPDAGELWFDGQPVDALTPAAAAELGIATVHQHPAVLPDMTVLENVLVSVPRSSLRSARGRRAAVQAMLDDVGCTAHLEDRVDSLSVAKKHLLELAKALVVRPRLLILDEPTAPLGHESVLLLFERIRRAVQSGASVVYITHRLAEVREIAQRVTVLRDGKFRGEHLVGEVTDDELLALIVGRQLDSTFPPKRAARPEAPLALQVEALSGPGFTDVSFAAEAGEIVGVAGIVGNGQTELLRALTGLAPFTGAVSIGGRAFGPRQLRAHSAYMPADRHADALMMTLGVRENASVTALSHVTDGLFVNRRREIETVRREAQRLAVKTPSLETPVSSLSGGNQQKVVMARALLSRPTVLLADEPTQGVDVGARSEIYKILREVSDSGVPVVVASSDAKELEGLCDRVVVLSRGHKVAELSGEEVSEDAIVGAAIRADARRAADAGRKRSSRLGRFVRGDYAPVAVLAAVILALGAYVNARNHRYLQPYNLNSLMLLAAALGFIAMGQTICLLLGGIDLSVGPLSGVLVVIASFFMTKQDSGARIVLGVVLMVLWAVLIGMLNGSLIRFLRFTPVAATLATFIALQGIAFVFRKVSGGYIARPITNVITHKIGRFPAAFLILVALTVLMELALRRTRWGLALRAVGSQEDAARKVGIRVTRTVLAGYVAASLFVVLGAVMLLAQIGVGDPAQGEGYTLASVTAVVLGGTSLLGGRGTFVGTLLGAVLSVQVLNATTFLELSQTWVYFFQGALVVAAALIYSQVRGRLGRRV